MNHYEITYQKKSDDGKKVWRIEDKKDLEKVLKQLKRLSASFDGDMIGGVDQLLYFKIIEKNYEYEKDGDYYIEYIDEGDGAKYESIKQIAFYHDLEVSDVLVPYYKDITNDMLHKFEIQGDDYKKQGKVLFEDGILKVNTYDFSLEENSKIYELFSLLFRAQGFYNKSHFTYDELKKILKEGDGNNSKLKSHDMNHHSINDVVGKKLNSIKTKTGMPYKILKISLSEIAIWQESASIQ